MAKTTHGHSRRRGRTPVQQFKTYYTWTAMRARCRNKTSPQYKNYGARGITVCDRWQTFENFLADMGEKPTGLPIDRIDVNGNYEPGNCRWATSQQQVRNRTVTKLSAEAAARIRELSDGGLTQEWIGFYFGVSRSMVYKVVNGRAWS